MGNTFKTAFLLTAMTLLLMMLGRAFGGPNGMVWALGLAVVMNFVAYFYSDKLALAAYRAQPATREQLPQVYDIVERLTQAAREWGGGSAVPDDVTFVVVKVVGDGART